MFSRNQIIIAIIVAFVLGFAIAMALENSNEEPKADITEGLNSSVEQAEDSMTENSSTENSENGNEENAEEQFDNSLEGGQKFDLAP